MSLPGCQAVETHGNPSASTPEGIRNARVLIDAVVCRVLEIAKPENAYSRLDADEKGARKVGTLGGASGTPTCSKPFANS